MPELAHDDLEHILRHTGSIWEEARGRQLFITGGTGFFGCWLLESFLFINRALCLNARATVLSRDPERFLQKCPHLAGKPGLRFVRGDVCKLLWAGDRYDLVIHAATEASERQALERPLEMFSTIVEGTRQILEFSRQCGAHKFLLTSSGAIYGNLPPEITHVREDFTGGPDCLNRSSVYAEGKRAAELQCILYSSPRFEVKIARCFAFVGPHLPLDTHFAIGNFLRDALRGGPIMVNGDGTPRRSYLYAADLTAWLWTILFRGQSGWAYNVGSENAYSISEVARTVAESVSPSLKVVVMQKADDKTAIRRYVPSTARAREHLGLEERFSLVDAITNTIKWHRVNIAVPIMN